VAKGRDDLRAGPSEQVDHQPWAEPASGANPLVLEVVEPAGEAFLVGNGGDGAVVPVALAGEPA